MTHPFQNPRRPARSAVLTLAAAALGLSGPAMAAPTKPLAEPETGVAVPDATMRIERNKVSVSFKREDLQADPKAVYRELQRRADAACRHKRRRVSEPFVRKCTTRLLDDFVDSLHDERIDRMHSQRG